MKYLALIALSIAVACWLAVKHVLGFIEAVRCCEWEGTYDEKETEHEWIG